MTETQEAFTSRMANVPKLRELSVGPRGPDIAGLHTILMVFSATWSRLGSQRIRAFLG